MLEPTRPPETGLLSEGPRKRECRARGMAWMAQLSVCHVWVSPFLSDQQPESRMPEMGLSGLEGGARFKPSSLPLSLKPQRRIRGQTAYATIPRPRGRGPVEAAVAQARLIADVAHSAPARARPR